MNNRDFNVIKVLIAEAAFSTILFNKYITLFQKQKQFFYCVKDYNTNFFINCEEYLFIYDRRA